MQSLTDQELAELRHALRGVLDYLGADICGAVDPLTYVSPEGDTSLHIAASRGDIRTVQLLVKAGLDPNQLGDMGNTALHCASTPEVAAFLERAGASTSIKNEFGDSTVRRTA